CCVMRCIVATLEASIIAGIGPRPVRRRHWRIWNKSWATESRPAPKSHAPAQPRLILVNTGNTRLRCEGHRASASPPYPPAKEPALKHLRPITLALAIALATSVSALAIAKENTTAPAAADLRSMASVIFQPIPDPPTEIRGEKITPEKIELGRMLFFEPRLSRSHIISCNTCHSIGTGGADNVPVSIGHGWQKGPRNSPTVFNAVFNAAQFWDGRADDLM